ncbi:MAG: hypothetical protein FWC61_00975 [Proteobacteria bacterium]|nr:hypothetical protein [Pseudomonadota bacterium]
MIPAVFRMVAALCAFVGANNYLPLQWFGLGTGGAYATQIANVGYVHAYIAAKTGVTVPINPVQTNVAQAVNVHYLLAVIDKLNELSPASTATTYQTHPRATQQVADTWAVANAVNRLFNCNVGGYWKQVTVGTGNHLDGGGANDGSGTGGSVRCVTCSAGSFCPAGQETPVLCNTLSGVNPVGGSFASVSPFGANTDCRYTAPNKTITGCASVTSQQVAYNGASWPASTYSVSASAGYYISNNNTSGATCTICPKDYYCTGGANAAVPCSTIGAGYVTDGTGASASSQCHAPAPLIAKDMICYNDSTNTTISYTGGNTNMNCNWGFGSQPVAGFSGYYVTGTCTNNPNPSGCNGYCCYDWSSSSCLGSPTYSASGIYCWCRLMRISDGAFGRYYVSEGDNGSASGCANRCAGACIGYVNNAGVINNSMASALLNSW